MNKILFALLFAGVSVCATQATFAGKTLLTEKEDMNSLTSVRKKVVSRIPGTPTKPNSSARMRAIDLAAKKQGVEVDSKGNTWYLVTEKENMEPLTGVHKKVVNRTPGTPTKPDSAARMRAIDRAAKKQGMEVDSKGNTWYVEYETR